MQIKGSKGFRQSILKDTLFHVDLAFNELSLADIVPLLRMLHSYSFCTVALHVGENHFAAEELYELLDETFGAAGLA